MRVLAHSLTCLKCGTREYTLKCDEYSQWNKSACPECGHMVSLTIGAGDDAIDGRKFVVDTLECSPHHVHGLTAIEAAAKFKEWDDKYGSKYLALDMDTEYLEENGKTVYKLVYTGLRMETDRERMFRIINQDLEDLVEQTEEQEKKKARYARYLELKAKYGR